jgi:UPF0176 protein
MGHPIVSIEVSAFYKFVRLVQFEAVRDPLRALCVEHGIRGTVLLAPEGINGTIAGDSEAMSAVLAFLRSYREFRDLEVKTSFTSAMPFQRMKVRLKKEIVTLGVHGVDPNKSVGQYVQPEDWNALITEPGVVIVDTRNGFEIAKGTFKGAIDPETTSFGEFPEFVRSRLAAGKSKKIAMFCTGGIRCEKATSFLLNEGFEQVFHLKGGILKYLEVISPEQSLWQGTCFVFDERAGLGHGLVEAVDNGNQT